MLADRPVDPNGARTTAHRYSSQFHVWKRYAIHTVEDPGVDRSMTTHTFTRRYEPELFALYRLHSERKWLSAHLRRRTYRSLESGGGPNSSGARV